MDIRVKLSQHSSLSQQLNLAPQLLQWLRILQTPSVDLQNIVQSELESNPALEIETEPPAAEERPEQPEVREMDFSETVMGEKFEELASIDDDWRSEGAARSGAGVSSDDEDKYDFLINSTPGGKTLYQHLEEQIGFLELPEDQNLLSRTLIGYIDRRGYFASTVEEAAADTETSPSQVATALETLQDLDPIGVGARDLRECLLIQLKHLKDTDVAQTVVQHYIEPLSRGLYGEIAREMGVSEQQVLAAHGQISSCTPYPGEKFHIKDPEYIEADIEVTKEDGTYKINLLDQRIPRLKISAACKRLLKKGKLSPEEVNYIKNRVRAASFLIEGIHQREQTLRGVTNQIIRFQKDFFASNHGKLKPLTMAKVGAILKIHETTVSRAIANKYVRTSRGIFPMRQFFIQGYRCADGSAYTQDAVKDMISKIVREENKDKPLRDVDISAQLKDRGLKIARRTIAKYRKELGIPSSKERCTTAIRKQAPQKKLTITEKPQPVTTPAYAVA